ncbi:GCFC2 factor, partial [Centropus unirufus]|nr:GCFC2 factor [Centropus unirufus]
GRRRAASSSSEEEPPAPGSQRETEPGESEEEEEEAGGAGTREERGGAAADTGSGSERARGGSELLSFGGEEEREGDEFFKIKKPSFNEVTFRIQRKESPLPAQWEESKKICQSEPGSGDTEGSHEEEDGDTSQTESYNSSDSENGSSSPQRRKDSSPGGIPSAACIDAARRRRHLARTGADYLPLEAPNSHQASWRREGSDLESEDESERKNLDFAPKMRTLRQRMTEHMGECGCFSHCSV